MTNKTPKKFSEFGGALSYVLVELGIEQRWLANKLGAGDDQISNYVKNKSTPRKGRRRKIEKLLGCNFEKKGTDWLVSINPDVMQAGMAFDEATPSTSGYSNIGQGQGEIVQSLELAKRLIDRSLQVLKK